MYQHIMVPLDGSELAECVLSHVEMIAKSCQVPRITLIRVATPLKLYSGFDYGGLEVAMAAEVMQRIEDDNVKTAEEYLQKQVQRLETKGIIAQAEVVFGDIADSLINFAEKNRVDLIIIATHGRSGIKRWVLGSIADRILRTSKIPILMVQPQDSGATA
ncbi:MAG: universal stress protein [Chloroflexi bacterium]|nr:universal stress protein [Chloroflexota bacterium]